MAIPVNRNLCGVNSTWAVEVDVPFAPENTVRSAPGEDATLVYLPFPGRKYRVGVLSGSIVRPLAALPPSVATLTIHLSTGALVYQLDLVTSFPAFVIVMKPPLSAEKNIGMTINLSSPGPGAILCLNASVWAYSTEGSDSFG